MSAVGLPPAFIPPVVVLPAASAVVPAVAGAAATGVALPVLPLVGAVAVGAAVAGAAALAVAAVVNAQRWGLLNDRQGAGQAGNWQGPVDVPVTGASVVVGGRDGSGSMVLVVGPEVAYLNPAPIVVPDNVTVSAGFVHVPNTGGYYHGWVYEAHWTIDGVAYSQCVKGGGFGNCIHDQRDPDQPPFMTVEGWVYQPDGAPVPEVTPTYPSPAAPPQVVPDPLPAVVPIPTQPNPLPLEVPDLPDAEPVAPPANPPGAPTTTPATRPATKPVAPAVPRPVPIGVPAPEAEPIVNGAIVPQSPPPPTVTPTDAHVVNGLPVRSPGPQPTPEGIAKEVGRIEEKLAQLLSPSRAPMGDQTDRLGLIFQLLQTLIEFLTAVNSGGDYQLSSPCVLDEDDQRIVSTVEYSGATTTLGVVLNKLDALAELLQVHKDLKQPICRQLPPVGQPVTVNFVQTD